MQVIDSLLQPASELFISGEGGGQDLKSATEALARDFKIGFIEKGGFAALLSLFTGSEHRESSMGDVVALRVLKFCLFGDVDVVSESFLLKQIKDPVQILKKLAAVALSASGNKSSATNIKGNVILDVVIVIRLFLKSSPIFTQAFINLPNNYAENIVTHLLLRSGLPADASPEESAKVSTILEAQKVRQAMSTTILEVPELGSAGFPWLLNCLEDMRYDDDCVREFFSVLRRLVKGTVDESTNPPTLSGPSSKQLKQLGTAICVKLANHPRSNSDMNESTSMLSGCLALLRRLLETKLIGGGAVSLADGC